MSPAATQDNLTPPNQAADDTVLKTNLTDAVLALYLGEIYAEVEVRTIGKLKSKVMFKKSFFLPQSSLKTTLNQVQKNLTELNLKITDAYVVCRYLERLKTFRLGGSVVWI